MHACTHIHTHTHIFLQITGKRQPESPLQTPNLLACDLAWIFHSPALWEISVLPPSVWCSISSPDQDSLFPSCALWKEVALHILHWSSGGLMLHLHEEEHLLKFSGNLYHFFQDMPMRIQCPPGAQGVCISLSFLLLHDWYPQFFLSVSCRIWHPLCSWC